MNLNPDSELSPGHDDFVRACVLEKQARLEDAIRHYRLAAKKGCSSACINLGNLFDDQFEPPQPKEAVHWYRRAVALGSRAGAWNLSVHYRRQKNQRWYLYWLRRAANMGEPDAKSLLRRKTVEQLLSTFNRQS